MNRFVLTVASLATLFCIASGCSEHHHDKDEQIRETRHWTLPDNLQPVAEGPAKLDYKAAADGRIYVTDVEDNVVVARKHIRAGQVLDVSPEQNMITIDGRSVLNQDLNKSHSHRIYFEQE